MRATERTPVRVQKCQRVLCRLNSMPCGGAHGRTLQHEKKSMSTVGAQPADSAPQHLAAALHDRAHMPILWMQRGAQRIVRHTGKHRAAPQTTLQDIADDKRTKKPNEPQSQQLPDKYTPKELSDFTADSQRRQPHVHTRRCAVRRWRPTHHRRTAAAPPTRRRRRRAAHAPQPNSLVPYTPVQPR